MLALSLSMTALLCDAFAIFFSFPLIYISPSQIQSFDILDSDSLSLRSAIATLSLPRSLSSPPLQMKGKESPRDSYVSLAMCRYVWISPFLSLSLSAMCEKKARLIDSSLFLSFSIFLSYLSFSIFFDFLRLLTFYAYVFCHCRSGSVIWICFHTTLIVTENFKIINVLLNFPPLCLIFPLLILSLSLSLSFFFLFFFLFPFSDH